MVKWAVWIIMVIGFKAGYIDNCYYYSEAKRLFFKKAPMAGASDVHWSRVGTISIHSYLFYWLTLNRTISCRSSSSGEEHGYTTKDS